mgnify:CR=1 FL=1
METLLCDHHSTQNVRVVQLSNLFRTSEPRVGVGPKRGWLACKEIFCNIVETIELLVRNLNIRNIGMNSSKKSPDYNIREKPLFATLVIGFVVTIFTMLLVYFNVIDLGSSSVDLIDVSVTCLAFYVSLKIAKIQSDTAKKIETIGTDTGKTAREILRRKGIEELVSSFFKIQPDKISKYKCVYPQEYPWKGPLPAIRLGDHYALRNIESWFGEDRVEFIGIQRKFTDDPQRKGKETRLSLIHI